MFIELQKYYPTIIKQYKQNWCKNIRNLPFDFVILEYKIIIELDGPQHFRQISNWQSPEINLKMDIYKMNCANKNNFSIIRILQEDVYYNKYDWLKEIIQCINKLINNNFVQNIFMCKKYEYDLHLSNMAQAVTENP